MEQSVAKWREEKWYENGGKKCGTKWREKGMDFVPIVSKGLKDTSPFFNSLSYSESVQISTCALEQKKGTGCCEKHLDLIKPSNTPEITCECQQTKQFKYFLHDVCLFQVW